MSRTSSCCTSKLILSGLTDGVFLPDGGLAVLNRYSQEVRLFSSDGSYQSALGRRGDGPGEFRDPIEITLLGSDSLAVWDWSPNRITIFPLLGGAPRTVRLDPPAPNPTGHFGVSGGSFIVGSHDLQPLGQPGSEGGEQWLNVLAYDMGGQLRDTIEVLPYGRYLWVDESNREAGYPHFEAKGTFSVRMGQLFLADGSDPVVWSRGPGEETRRRQIEWIPPDRDIRPRDLTAAHDFDLTRFSQPVLQQRVRRNWDVLPVADRFPALQEILGDDAGRLWVKRYPRLADGDRVWWLFDAGGTFRCALRIEDGFQPFEFQGEAVLGRVRDEFDVEYVEVRWIIEPR